MQQHTSTPAPHPTWEAPRVVDGSGYMPWIVFIFLAAMAAAGCFQVPRYWTQKRIDDATR